MADWDHDDAARAAPRPESNGPRERDWRGGRDWRGERSVPAPQSRSGRDRGPYAPEDRAFRGPATPGDRGEQDMRRARDEHPAADRQAGRGAEPGGGAHGYGDGGDSAFGQMAGGSSDSGLGGYGGADVGGWGQPNLNSQWGQGGYAPLNQGLDYGQDGARFGPQGYDTGRFGQAPRPSDRAGRGPEPHDEHHVHYKSWRDAQLASHDRDYSRWRDEQVRRYDEDYGSWRNERHAAFSQEFEGWRSGRGGQVVPAPSSSAPSAAGAAAGGTSATVNPSERSVYGQAAASSTAGDGGFAHGANPTLAKIADGQDGHQHHGHEDKGSERRDESKH